MEPFAPRAKRRALTLLLLPVANVVGLAAASEGSGGQWEAEAQLQGVMQQSGWRFGSAVDIDGDYAIVGANGADIGGQEEQGAAWIFKREGETWVEDAMLTASDGAEGDGFGVAVAIDGSVAIVGAPFDDDELNQGSFYYFIRGVGDNWIEVDKIRGSDSDEQDHFARALALEGDRLAVGAMRAGADTATPGAVYYFERIGHQWIERQKLTDSAPSSSHSFGWAVDLRGDDLVVGDFSNDTTGGLNSGAVFVYTFDGSNWQFQQKLGASDGTLATMLGFSVSLEPDALLAGAQQHPSPSGPGPGAAYVFRRSGGVWSEEQQLLASDAANNGNYYGTAVALRGNIALVGGESDNGAQIRQGIVYDNRYIDGEWVEVGTFRAPVGQILDTFGEALSFSGSRLLVGNSNNIQFEPHGIAWVFRLPPIFEDGFESGDTSAWSVTVP